VTEPHHEHGGKKHVHRGQSVNEPPAVPAALADQPEDGVEDGGATRHEDDLIAVGSNDPGDIMPNEAEHTEPARDPPAAGLTARHGVEVAQSLFERR
jgi:hypothetical protein